MVLPVRLDHIPPEVLKRVNAMQHQRSPEVSSDKVDELDPQAMASTSTQLTSSSFDVFSIGILLLNIISGKPHQVQLPMMLKQKTVRCQEYMDKPLLGRCYDKYDEDIVKDLVKSQVKLLNDLPRFLELHDRYKIARDADFVELLQSMLSLDSSLRPSIDDIIDSQFIKKWTET